MLIFDCNYVGWNSATAILKGNSKGLSFNGSRTEVIFQFIKRIVELANRFESQQIVFCWDSPDNKRLEIYPEYKEKRRKNREEHVEENIEAYNEIFRQFTEIKSFVLPTLGFSNIFEVNGFESDDIIANIVNHKNENQNIIVISSDEDLYQLLDNCAIYSISKQQTMTKEIFIRHYGITPFQWIAVKAIGGCRSDNVQGVEGVGETKSIDYLKGKLNKGKVFLRIENSEEIIKRNLRLVRLPFENTPLPKIRPNYLSLDKFKFICDEFGFESLKTEKIYSMWKNIAARVNR